ncbi:MAG: ribonuclease P protein component [Bifidobacteriaceae bacterium]|nr:ribonuclease P protein component [Bifidobacteriaceae bacterium]
MQNIEYIRRKTAFQKVFTSGKRLQAHNMRIVYCKSDSKAYAVIVPKIVSKKAVDRNKIKRRIKEVVRKNAEKFPKEISILFMPRLETKNMKFSDLESEILEIFESL